VSSDLSDALRAMRNGIPVLIYDSRGRENEVDYVIHASRVDVDIVYEMRTLAGGLICYAMPLNIGRDLGLRYAYEYYSQFPELEPLTRKTLSYGDKPAFSIWVNYLDVATGIRDEDRATTIRELDRVNELVYRGRLDEAKNYFQENFVAPGHVPILLGRSLWERRGHTELSLHLAAMADTRPSTVVVEMLTRGRALDIEKARKISTEYGYPLVTMKDIVAEAEKHGRNMYCRYKLC